MPVLTDREEQGHVEEDIKILIADRIAQEGIDLHAPSFQRRMLTSITVSSPSD